MKIFYTMLGCLVLATTACYAQEAVDREKFFADSALIPATLTLNINRVILHKDRIGYIIPATFAFTMPGANQITDSISAELRGHFRRDYCYMPPLKLDFDYDHNAVLHHLKSLKLVSACKENDIYDDYLLKEYLVYKIYNIITDKSFRARLLELSYKDSSGRKKTVTAHAFLLEDAKDVAKRNGCTEFKKVKVPTESADRKQMTIVAIFEYMIGNTDWAVPVEHNVKLIGLKDDANARPYVIPYDFDYSGLVNAEYAIPDERLGIENVRQRLYRGFPRNIGEINEALDVFKRQKDSIYTSINNFTLLNKRAREEMTDYLDEFYKTINNPADAQATFITNARTQ